MLSSGSDFRPIHEIAAERGLIDPSEFSPIFKHPFGHSPSKEGRPTPERAASLHLASAVNFGEVFSALA